MELLLKNVGVENATKLTGRSYASLQRYKSLAPKNISKFPSVHTVQQLERVSDFAYLTVALGELADANDVWQMHTCCYDKDVMHSLVVQLCTSLTKFLETTGACDLQAQLSVNDRRDLLIQLSDLQRIVMSIRHQIETLTNE